MSQISIIIPTYNSGKTVRAALESVYSQTFQDWECIVVDGASKDDTLDIVKEYCEKDSRFRYISEKDHGIYDAFNKGWKMAKSEWVHYLGSDDRLTSDGIENLMKNNEDGDLIVGNTFLVKPWGELTKQVSHGRMGCHQSMITRRSVIEALGGFDEQYRIVADADLNVRLVNAGYKLKNVDCFVSFFSVEGVSQSMNSNWRRNKELYLIYKRSNSCKYPFFICAKKFIMGIIIGVYRKYKMI